MDDFQQQHIRFLDEPVAGDGEWNELLDAIRRWVLLYGAPERAVVEMVEDDYRILLTREQVRWLLNGTTASPAPRH